ncbi:hypothetical protein [Corynebacterium bouchesdurhonense]|uniref:hypothetical protein n=1 Tax=Corynebacterium bouchesdurhonense TaxID=1720192 RepID=UPI000834DA68|nr:hypothetical protein [Corynebacterium bouchesdurhonense]
MTDNAKTHSHDTNHEGLYTSSANLISDSSQGHGGCGCGGNHNHNHGDGHGHGEGCGCGCGDQDSKKDYTDPDVVREDGTNPAVTTVEEAPSYNQDAAWNDGVLPQDGGDAEASGAADTGKEQIN